MSDFRPCRDCKDYRECEAEADCRKCRDYRQCIGKDWYDSADIRWCPYQVMWILEHRETLKGGEWPEDNTNSPNSQTNVRTQASFEKCIDTIAEVEERLKKTGWQAELLITQVEDGRTFDTLSKGAREVLMYVKGFRRKRIGFRKWLRVIYYGHKGVPKGQLVAT